jgi:hypothetical protein
VSRHHAIIHVLDEYHNHHHHHHHHKSFQHSVRRLNRKQVCFILTSQLATRSSLLGLGPPHLLAICKAVAAKLISP